MIRMPRMTRPKETKFLAQQQILRKKSLHAKGTFTLPRFSIVSDEMAEILFLQSVKKETFAECTLSQSKQSLIAATGMTAGTQVVTWKNIGINMGHFSEKYRANIGKSSKI